jgi:hypothetical protein
MLHRIDLSHGVATNNHIINIDKEKSEASGRCFNKERVIRRGLSVMVLNQERCESFIPSPTGLFETIKGLDKLTHLIWLGSNNARGQNHINIFF